MHRRLLAAAAASLLVASAAPGQSAANSPPPRPAVSLIPSHIELTPDPPPPNRPYTNLYVFGDSYSDTGAGHLESNGATAVAVLAQRLGIPLTWYGAPDMQDRGINFAVSGARTGEADGILNDRGELLAVGMINQVERFRTLLEAGTIRFDPAQTMFFLAGGLNDRNVSKDYTRTNLEQEIETLYVLGARRFTVALLPVKIEQFDVPATRNNPGIAQVPAQEQARHPDIRIALSNWGPYFDQVITHPTRYGITDTTSPCANPDPHDPAQNPDATSPCLHPDAHFFFYPAHPSAAAHRAVGNLLLEEALTKAP